MLKAINAIKPGQVIPVALIICTAAAIPDSSLITSKILASIILPVALLTTAIPAARTPNVAITFSFATSPVTAATANTHP